MAKLPEPLGAVLAGGAGTRLGGAKATIELGGEPLIARPLAAFAAAGIEAVVVAKRDTPLPPLRVETVLEADEPRHPLAGVLAALERGGGRPVVVCACDMPFVPPELLGRLAEADRTTVVETGTRLHPLLARYEPMDATGLRAGLVNGDSASAAARALGPRTLDVPSSATYNVNTPDDLAEAEARLAD